MASWKSTGTYVDEFPPYRANTVDGMWIFRVKQPPGSPPAFKARYVVRGFCQRQGVDYFQTFSPTPKMTTLRHNLLQGSLNEEIWLRRPPGFTGSFSSGTQWSLRRPVYGLREVPREWHDTLRTTLAALGFTPSTTDPSFFLCTDTSLPPFYVLVYVDDLVFATADTEALTLVKSELQKRHTCTNLGELRSYLGLQITRDRARRTIILTRSHMVHQVLQRFGFQFSSPQPTPLSTGHSLSAPPSDESWGLHMGIEKHYNAWKIFYVHLKETVAACDVIFYERLTLQTYLDNLAANRDLTGGFCGNRAFASAADEADWDEKNVDNASKEAGPLPYSSVTIPMDDENPRESVKAETYFDFANTGYVTLQPVNTNISERIGPNFLPDPEAGDEATYPEDTNLPCYTQSGLQILDSSPLSTEQHHLRSLPPFSRLWGGEHREKWCKAMDRELKALQERNTWKVVPIGVARNKTILTGKWVFRVKTKADGTIDKFKARWVVCGFDQE
ncbi:unnamed protein product [Closterium sp. NIES-53]